VVDDTQANREIFIAYLKPWKCQCDAVKDAMEAIPVLHKAVDAGKSYDLAIIDYMMPHMDGETLGRIIKSDIRLRDILLVMLTSCGRRGDAARMKEIGFAAYLSKPIKRSQLLYCLTTVLNGTQGIANKQKPLLVTKHTINETKKLNTRILLVEDNLFNQRLVERLLEKHGYTKIDIAVNGKEAIKALEADLYDIVFMDVQMPEMDGFEATGIIRDPNSKVLDHNVHIIAMTAHAMAGDEKRCLDAGMNSYISKPIDSRKLLQVIEKKLSEDNGNTDEII
jgi:CheY-like chemotaxis protein